MATAATSKADCPPTAGILSTHGNWATGFGKPKASATAWAASDNSLGQTAAPSRRSPSPLPEAELTASPMASATKRARAASGGKKDKVSRKVADSRFAATTSSSNRDLRRPCRSWNCSKSENAFASCCSAWASEAATSMRPRTPSAAKACASSTSWRSSEVTSSLRRSTQASIASARSFATRTASARAATTFSERCPSLTCLCTASCTRRSSVARQFTARFSLGPAAVTPLAIGGMHAQEELEESDGASTPKHLSLLLFDNSIGGAELEIEDPDLEVRSDGWKPEAESRVTPAAR
mmetsp:Transcript_86914/g.243543  ORF Transcript_86914/g.243543 Transcript_86914/m.243543 type:complete len:295 (+) Transcript_86914:483-1367(+)